MQSGSLRRGVVLVALIGALAIAGAAAILFDRSQLEPAPSECKGVDVPSGSDLQQVIDQHAASTTFCLAEGTFRVSTPLLPREGTQLIGAGIDKTYLEGTGAEIIIDAKGSAGVLIAHMDISGARGNPRCRPSCGSGFRGGRDNTVEFVRLHDNVNHGIGGSEQGLVVANSILDHNGSRPFTGCCAGGIKGGIGFTIRASEVFANIGNGIWCDSGCPGGMEAIGNTIFDNTRSGIRYEVSWGGATVSDNVINSNDRSGDPGAHAGIAVIASRNALITRNTIGDNNGHAIVVRDTPRGASENVRIERNEILGQTIDGCGAEVTCIDNR
ncbi:MAG: right-handed parallel beta-helix repeat-containing protein [Actinomycetota bacterium]